MITAAPEIGIRMDKRQCQHRSFKINPEINQFPIYLLDVVFPEKSIRMDGYIPDDNIVHIYTNAFLPVTRISLSIDSFDMYKSSLAHIRFNGDKVFGYNNKINDFFIESDGDNWFSCQTKFEDENGNSFSYLGYSNDGATPSEYDYVFDVVKDGQVVQSYILNPYSDIFELDLPDGSYGVIAYPAYNNQLYDRVSYFRMILNSNTQNKISFTYLTDSAEYDINNFNNVSVNTGENEGTEETVEHLGAQINYVLSDEERLARDQIEAERNELIIIILNKYGYYTDELLEEYLRTGDATPVGRDIP
jgi:hypothetical protein